MWSFFSSQLINSSSWLSWLTKQFLMLLFLYEPSLSWSDSKGLKSQSSRRKVFGEGLLTSDPFRYKYLHLPFMIHNLPSLVCRMRKNSSSPWNSVLKAVFVSRFFFLSLYNYHLKWNRDLVSYKTITEGKTEEVAFDICKHVRHLFSRFPFMKKIPFWKTQKMTVPSSQISVQFPFRSIPQPPPPPTPTPN